MAKRKVSSELTDEDDNNGGATSRVCPTCQEISVTVSFICHSNPQEKDY